MFEFDVHFHYYTKQPHDVMLFYLLDYTNLDWLYIELINQRLDIFDDVLLNLMLCLYKTQVNRLNSNDFFGYTLWHIVYLDLLHEQEGFLFSLPNLK